MLNVLFGSVAKQAGREEALTTSDLCTGMDLLGKIIPTCTGYIGCPFPKKSLNDGSTQSFSSPSLDQTPEDKVSYMQGSRIQFPTLLSMEAA